MVRKIILLFVLLALPFSAVLKAQELVESPIQFVTMFSGWTDNSFSTGVDAGFKMGFLVPFDEERGMRLRTLYSQWELNPPEVLEVDGTAKSFELTLLFDWYAGKKWTFYLDVGPEFYLSGPLDGTDFGGGFGASRRIATGNNTNYTTQMHVDAFGEIKFNDGSSQYSGNYLQLNVGIKFGRPIK